MRCLGEACVYVQSLVVFGWDILGNFSVEPWGGEKIWAKQTKHGDIVTLEADTLKRRWKTRWGMDDSGGTEGSVPAKENPTKYFGRDNFFFGLGNGTGVGLRNEILFYYVCFVLIEKAWGISFPLHSVQASFFSLFLFPFLLFSSASRHDPRCYAY